MIKSAVISPCGQFRYSLTRKWGDGKTLVFIMLNPSTADADVDDPTIRKCIGFARRMLFTGIQVVNLYAYRSRFPADIQSIGWPQGEANNDYVREAINNAKLEDGMVILAWGANARHHEHAERMLNNIKLSGVRYRALRLLADGTPAHPLMLPYSCIDE